MSTRTSDVVAHGHVLTPGRYVGAFEIEDDAEPFEGKITRLYGELASQFAESLTLQQAIEVNFKKLRVR
jgi:type I restriction enzyme M protein